MSPDLVALLYLAAGVLFILALRGLSSPETSRQGNYMGMAGMASLGLPDLPRQLGPTAAGDGNHHGTCDLDQQGARRRNAVHRLPTAGRRATR